jgi:hypothetical protein
LTVQHLSYVVAEQTGTTASDFIRLAALAHSKSKITKGRSLHDGLSPLQRDACIEPFNKRRRASGFPPQALDENARTLQHPSRQCRCLVWAAWPAPGTAFRTIRIPCSVSSQSPDIATDDNTET